MTWPVARRSSLREPACATMSAVVRSIVALSIWLAIERIQISS